MLITILRAVGYVHVAGGCLLALAAALWTTPVELAALTALAALVSGFTGGLIFIGLAAVLDKK